MNYDDILERNAPLWLHAKDRVLNLKRELKVAEDIVKELEGRMLPSLGTTDKEGVSRGTFRFYNLPRSRQTVDTKVLKTEHPAIYDSVLRLSTWTQFGIDIVVEYEPASSAPPPVPMMFHAVADDAQPF
jgi:predicted phage-related endonuclease